VGYLGPLYCKFPVGLECDSERILKIGQYLTKLSVDYVGLLFLAHPVAYNNDIICTVDATVLGSLLQKLQDYKPCSTQ